jgi:hypothetical protein
VNFDASTFTNGRAGELGQAARDLGLPAPRGADRMRLFEAISARIASGARCRRHRLRSAMATAFLASAWPTMYRSSSATIWRGVRSASLAIACCVLFDSMGAELSAAGPRRRAGGRRAPAHARRGAAQAQQEPVQSVHLPQQGAASQPQAQRHFVSSQQQAASVGVGMGQSSGGRGNG